MEKEPSIVIRVKGTLESDQAISKNILESVATPAAIEGAVLVTERAELDRQEIQDLRRDSSILGTAPALPVQLVTPVATLPGELAQEPINGASWGVYVTGALDSPYTGNDIVVAVLDTGIDAAHEAFNGVTLVQQDFTGEGNGDTNGHGTHVAGTIFGQPRADLRYSVAPGVKRALIGKVLGSKGGGSSDQIFCAIQWAIAQGAMVINMSLRLDFPGYVERLVGAGWPLVLATSRALQAYRDNVRLFDAVTALYRRQASVSGVSALLIGAAGNESRRDLKPDYTVDVAPPAAAEGIISVGAVGTAGAPHTALTVAPFSNVNPLVCAPGVGIYSAKAGGGYAYMNGTSMASPHVTGVAALWMEWQRKRSGRLDYNIISNRLVGTASSIRLQTPDDIGSIGAGLVQAPPVL